MNDFVLMGITLVICLGILYTFGFFHDNTKALEYCETKYGSSNSTHRIEVYLTQGTWLCGERLMSCTLDGKHCTSTSYTIVGEYNE